MWPMAERVINIDMSRREALKVRDNLREGGIPQECYMNGVWWSCTISRRVLRMDVVVSGSKRDSTRDQVGGEMRCSCRE
jgi:hypothetical protein